MSSDPAQQKLESTPDPDLPNTPNPGNKQKEIKKAYSQNIVKICIENFKERVQPLDDADKLGPGISIIIFKKAGMKLDLRQ